MISVNDMRRGMYVRIDGELYKVEEWNHHKPGKGGAIVRTKLRNVRTGAAISKTFKTSEKVEDVTITRRSMQYLYNDGSSFVFMDNKTFDQINIPESAIGDAKLYLIEGINVDVEFDDNDEVVGIQLPITVDLKIIETDPGLRGDTASGGSKPAKLETGLVVQVPLFVSEGEVIRIDTRTNEYVERVS